MKSTRLLTIPAYFLFGIALLISAGCKKTPGSPTRVTYTISFEVNGGTGDPPPAITFTHNQENLRAPAKPAGLSAPAGRNFAGWNTKRDGSGDNYPVNFPLNTLAKREQDITLYAQWDVPGKTYTISFDKNGGTGNPPLAITFTHNQGNLKAPTKPAGLSAPPGKILTGWNTETDGSGDNYPADSPLNTLTWRAQDATLYARWRGWVVTTIAGSSSNNQLESGTTDGFGTAARFNYPAGVAVDKDGNIYVADTSNHRIRKITPEGEVTTIAGSSSSQPENGTTNGSGTAARFHHPAGVAVDKDGNIYVADYDNHRIRKITPEGEVTTIAGSSSSQPESGTTNGSGTAARFNNPVGVAVDKDGNIYVADTSNHRIRKIEYK